MKCPGQDRRYWTQDAVFEVPCPQCGANVELFKDENKGRCPSCGHRFTNPGADFGCAKWCALAQECLGFAPGRPLLLGATEGALAARLIQSLKQHCGQQPGRIAQAMTLFQYTQELLVKQGGDPRVALCAALLLGCEMGSSGTPPSSAGDAPPQSRQILQELALDEATTDAICRTIDACRQGETLDTAEFRIVRDAVVLARQARGLQPPGFTSTRLPHPGENRHE